MVNPPSAVIFLDPESALLDYFHTPGLDQYRLGDEGRAILSKHPHFFNRLTHQSDCLWQRALTHHFDPSAKSALDDLVARISHQFRVIIVITSRWGNAVANEDDLKYMLADTSFVDKVEGRLQHHELGHDASLIDEFLRNQYDRLNIQRFLIIGNLPGKNALEIRFSTKYVQLPYAQPMRGLESDQAVAEILNQQTFHPNSLLSQEEVLSAWIKSSECRVS